ncbi:Potassium channel [Tilletia horrida]|nr:Potassium channel [Tilletia horrida]
MDEEEEEEEEARERRADSEEGDDPQEMRPPQQVGGNAHGDVRRGSTTSSSTGRAASRRRQSQTSTERRRSSVEHASRADAGQGEERANEDRGSRRRSSVARAALLHPEFAHSGTSSDDDDDDDQPVLSERKASGQGRLAVQGSTERSSRAGRRSSIGPTETDTSARRPSASRGSSSRQRIGGPRSSDQGWFAESQGEAARPRHQTDSPVSYSSDEGDAEGGIPITKQTAANAGPQHSPDLPSQSAPQATRLPPALDPSARPSKDHSAHHWQRFYNLLHPNFLHSHQAGPPPPETKNFPRTLTWGSEAFSSDGESHRQGPGSMASAKAPRVYGRGAAASTQPAISFRKEVSVGGRLHAPTIPSILRRRDAPSIIEDDQASEPPLTPSTPKYGRGSGRPGLAMRRTMTNESEMSVSALSDTDFSMEDEDEVVNAVVGSSRKTRPKPKKPLRSLTNLATSATSLPLRGWARRRQQRENGVIDLSEDQDGRTSEDPEALSQSGEQEQDDEDADSDDELVKVQQYRKTPIVSGVLAPFSIMLEVPGFTSSWYLSTGRDQEAVVYAKNPPLLDVGLGFSMGFAVIANLSIVLRFLEVLRPRKSTLIAIVLLTLHDLINITALAVFGKIHAVNDGFTYSEGYWMTLGSTLTSTIVNFTLIADYVNTKQFKDAGSGLTRKQRELVVMVMLVLFYLSIGALIYALLLKINFETALYFITCTLFTIGFGDITPNTTASRIVLFFYAPAGIVLIALVIATTRETILEQFEESYKKRRATVKARYLEKQEAKKVNRQLRRAVRLRQITVGRGGTRQWVAENGQILPNLAQLGLEPPQPEKAPKKIPVVSKLVDQARELFRRGFSRGWELDADRNVTLAPGGIEEKGGNGLIRPTEKGAVSTAVLVSAATTTSPAKGGIKLGTSSDGKAQNGSSPDSVDGEPIEDDKNDEGNEVTEQQHRDEIALMEESLRKQREEVENHWESFKHEVAQQERNEFVAKMVVSGSLFLIFWLMGAGVFLATEKWNFFEGLYFSFVFFSTIGYGDYSPKTPSGRAFFIVWAMFGVGILTVIFSVLGDAWGSFYKDAMRNKARKRRWKDRLGSHRRKKRKARAKSEDGGDNAEAAEEALEAGDGTTDSATMQGSHGLRRETSQANSILENNSRIASVAPSETDGPEQDTEVNEQNGEDTDASKPRRTSTYASSAVSQEDELPKRRLQPPDQIPLQLARAAMHLHSEASHLLESQRHVLADAVTSAPSLRRQMRKLLRTVAAGGKLNRGAVRAAVAGLPDQDDDDGERNTEDLDEEEAHIRELEKLESTAVSVLEREGDQAGVAAVRQLFALVHYDTHLSSVIENSHILRDTLLNQERELATLRARLTQLEATVETEIEEELGLDKDDEGPGDEQPSDRTDG